MQLCLSEVMIQMHTGGAGFCSQLGIIKKTAMYMKQYKVHIILGEGQEVHVATGPVEAERSGVKLYVKAMDLLIMDTIFSAAPLL